MSISEKRKKIEKLVLSVYSALDTTGENTKKMADTFKSMDDKAFAEFVNSIKDRKAYFQLEVLPFKNEPKLDDINKALGILKVPAEEYVYYPHEASKDGKPLRTKVPVPVGYIHVRRLQQILSKKNSYTADITKRNQLTGQVTGDSKIARLSDTETAALITMGANMAVKELLGPRADNKAKKVAMYQQISRDGYVTLQSLEGLDTVLDNTSLLTMDAYLLGAGLISDLINGSYILTSSKIKGGK
jgi:hypothetical protein